MNVPTRTRTLRRERLHPEKDCENRKAGWVGGGESAQEKRAQPGVGESLSDQVTFQRRAESAGQ